MDERFSKWVAISCVGMCLFISAMSWMCMKIGSMIVLMEIGLKTADGFSMYSWIVAAYIICEVGMIPISGKLIDHFGEKKVLSIGAILFIIGAVFGGCSMTINDLVLFRCIQGMGAGMVFAVAFSCVGKMFPNHKRNIAHEVMTAAFAVGSLYGTMIGYWFIEKWTWQGVLFFSAAIMAVCAFTAVKTLPDRTSVKKFDTVGAVLLSAIFFTVMIFTQCVYRKFQIWSMQSLYFLLAAIALIIVLYLYEKRKENPAFPMKINKTQGKCILAMFLVCLVGIGTIQYLMKMFMLRYGMNIYEGSFMFLYLLAGGAITSVVGCRKVTEIGVRFWIVLGSVLLTIGYFLVAFIGGNGVPQISFCMFVLGLGFGCMVTEILCAMQAISPKKDMGIYTSLIMGIRMAAILLGNVAYAGYINFRVSSYAEGISGDPTEIFNLLSMLGFDIGEFSTAFEESMLNCAFVAAILFIVVALVGLWIKKDDLKIAQELDKEQ